MILFVHMLFGAAIGSLVNSVPLAIILAYFSHYFLDLFPHIEYPIENIKEKQWRKALPDFLKVFLDFCLGALLIFLLSKNQLIVYVYAFFAILPDGLALLNKIFKNKILNLHDNFHGEKIHFLKYKKISKFWRIFTQVTVIFISIILFRI